MKIEKSNNPVAVGALILVLALIVGRIFWMVFGHSGSVAAASTVPSVSPTPSAPPAPVPQGTPAAAATPAPEPEMVPPAVTPTTTRNPFSSAVKPAHDAAPRASTTGKALPLTALPPLPVRVMETGPETGVRQLPLPHTVGDQTPKPIVTGAQPQAAPALKLTAIVGGMEPMAVVQTTNPAPVILHVGDLLDGMRVAAIHDREVIFARGSGFWTLPLQSAADGVANSVSVTSEPAASGPVISAATPEENTDDPQ